ncbi:MAG: hypothetical protein PHE15_05310 [Dehalococcoidales bacterium]|nr:hypothetical protein [Dehalococcoidales bacterium]
MDILKLVVAFIKEHHPDAGALIKDYTSFVNNIEGKRLQGYSRAVYTGDNWNISIGHAVTPLTIYQIRADYNNGEIVWVGQIKNRQVEEKSYERVLPE